MYSSLRLGKLNGNPPIILSLSYSDESNGRPIESIYKSQPKNPNSPMTYYNDISNYYLKLQWYESVPSDYRMENKSYNKKSTYLFPDEFRKFIRLLSGAISVINSKSVFNKTDDGKIIEVKDESKPIIDNIFSGFYLRIYPRILRGYTNSSNRIIQKDLGMNIDIRAGFRDKNILDSYTDVYSGEINLDDVQNFIDSYRYIDFSNLIINNIVNKRLFDYEQKSGVQSHNNSFNNLNIGKQITRKNIFEKANKEFVSSNMNKASSLDSLEKYE